MRADDYGGGGCFPCPETECLWNTYSMSGEADGEDDRESLSGHGGGIRICNYDNRAVILGLPVPANCPHKSRVYGVINVETVVEVKQDSEMVRRVNDYIEAKAQEARARLGLSMVSSG